MNGGYGLRKYVCDNCGTIFNNDERKIISVETFKTDYDNREDYDDQLGEFCEDCLDTLKNIIKAGFSKGRA